MSGRRGGGSDFYRFPQVSTDFQRVLVLRHAIGDLRRRLEGLRGILEGPERRPVTNDKRRTAKWNAVPF